MIILQHSYQEDVMKKIASFESSVWNKKPAMFHIKSCHCHSCYYNNNWDNWL